MKLIEYLPEYMQNVEDINEIADCEQPCFDELNTNIEKMQNEMFVETAAEYGIERLEKMLGIDGMGYEDLDFRRFRLLLKLVGGKRLSIAERLDDLVGEGNYQMSFDMKEMCLEVRITVENKEFLEQVEDLLDRLIPCNVELDVRILYVSHKMLGQYTHKQLSAYPYDELKLIGL